MTRMIENTRRLARWWLDQTLSRLPRWLTQMGPNPAPWRWTGGRLVSERQTTTRGPWCLMLEDVAPIQVQRDLPITAAGHLRRIVGLQLGHWTPLTPATALFTAEIDDHGQGFIRVLITALPRASLAPALAAAHAMGLEPPTHVSVAGRLLPMAEPPDTPRLPPRLLLLALLLLAPPLALGLLQEGQAAHMRVALAAATMQAEQARALALRVDRAKAQTLAAVMARQQAPSLLLALDRLAQVLPDAAYLTEMRWVDGRLHLIGYGRDSAGLTALLDASPFFEDVRFEAALLRAGPQGDRFHLSLKVGADAPA